VRRGEQPLARRRRSPTLRRTGRDPKGFRGKPLLRQVEQQAVGLAAQAIEALGIFREQRRQRTPGEGVAQQDQFVPDRTGETSGHEVTL
jgi:hypothetical protein